LVKWKQSRIALYSPHSTNFRDWHGDEGETIDLVQISLTYFRNCVFTTENSEEAKNIK